MKLRAIIGSTVKSAARLMSKESVNLTRNVT